MSTIIIRGRHFSKYDDRIIGGRRGFLSLCIILVIILLFVQDSTQQDYSITKFESEIKLNSDLLCVAKVTERVSYIFDSKTKTITRNLPVGMPFGNNVEQVSAIIVSTTSNKIVDVDVYKSTTNSKNHYIQIDFSKQVDTMQIFTIEYKYSIRGPFFSFKNSTKFLWSVGNDPAQVIKDISVSVIYPTSLLSNVKTFGGGSAKSSSEGPETTILFKNGAELKSMQTFTPGFTATNMIFQYCKTTIHNPNVPVAMVTMFGPIIAIMLISLLIKAIVDNVNAYRAEKKFEQERNRIGKMDIQMARRPVSSQYSTSNNNHHTDDSELSYGSEEESHENQTLLSKSNKV